MFCELLEIRSKDSRNLAAEIPSLLIGRPPCSPPRRRFRVSHSLRGAAIHRKWEKVRVGRKEGRKEGGKCALVVAAVGGFMAVGRQAGRPMMMMVEVFGR